MLSVFRDSGKSISASGELTQLVVFCVLSLRKRSALCRKHFAPGEFTRYCVSHSALWELSSYCPTYIQTLQNFQLICSIHSTLAEPSAQYGMHLFPGKLSAERGIQANNGAPVWSIRDQEEEEGEEYGHFKIYLLAIQEGQRMGVDRVSKQVIGSN